MMPVSFIGIVKKNTFKSYKPQHSVSGPTYHNIHALLQDGDKLYIGMYMGGLDIMDLKTGSLRIISSVVLPDLCMHQVFMRSIKIPPSACGWELLMA